MDPQKPLSVDYLNQIAPTNQNQISKKTKILLVIAAIIASILAGWLALSMGGEPTAQRNDMLQYRLVTLDETAEQSHRYLTDSALRAANANLSTFTASALTVYGTPEFSDSDPSVAQQAEEQNSGLLSETLEDARLNSTYNRVYLREIMPQLISVKDTLSYLATSTSNQEQRAAYQESIDQLTIIIEDFEKAKQSD